MVKEPLEGLRLEPLTQRDELRVTCDAVVVCRAGGGPALGLDDHVGHGGHDSLFAASRPARHDLAILRGRLLDDRGRRDRRRLRSDGDEAIGVGQRGERRSDTERHQNDGEGDPDAAGALTGDAVLHGSILSADDGVPPACRESAC